MAECAPEAPSPGLAVEEAPGTAPWPGCSRSAESPLHSVPGCTSLGPVVLEAGGGFVLEREWINDCAPSSEGPPLPRKLQKAVGVS